MGDVDVGCAKPAGKSVGGAETDEKQGPLEEKKEGTIMTARVGGKAPDFEAPAFHNGGFTTVKLSDYLGKWVLICFYPGDFTFV